MRVTIKFDSATTEAVREMAVALNHVGLEGQLRVGLNGPECWHGETPPLTSHQWARVAAMLVKVGYGGSDESLAAFVDRHRS